MADHRIVCVTTLAPHRHIISAGTGDNPTAPSTTYTVSKVRSMIDGGETFHTVSPSTGAKAAVRKDTCPEPRCTVATIRSAADAVTDNNLDYLAACP
jgi:hypothetical protein